MNELHFKDQVNRLKKQFGDAAYSTERLQIIWRDVSRYSDDWFTRTVDHFLGSLRNAPLPVDFKEAIANASNADKGIKGSRGCSICSGNMWVLGPHVPGKAELAMRCDCVGGVAQLVALIRNHPQKPDPGLADDIEHTFRGMSPRHYRDHGFSNWDTAPHIAPQPRTFRSPDELLKSMPVVHDDDDR